jgi:hypothetical protein
MYPRKFSLNTHSKLPGTLQEGLKPIKPLKPFYQVRRGRIWSCNVATNLFILILHHHLLTIWANGLVGAYPFQTGSNQLVGPITTPAM